MLHTSTGDDSLNVELKVTAIRHLETAMGFDPSLHAKNTKYNSASSKKSRRLFRLIDDLDKYVHVNPQTGTIYLVNRIDREQILAIRFYLFVSDNKGVSTTSLTNSVPITIEIEDVNDSQPVCSSQSLPQRFSSMPQALEVFSVFIDLNSLGVASLYPPFSPFYSKTSRLVQAYQFECVDNDKNKNAELKYEVENFYLKNSDLTLNESVNDYFQRKKILVLNANNGMLYLNLSKAWLNANFNSQENKTEFSVEASFFKLLKNKFLIMKVRTSDKGIVSLFNYYYLKFMFCFRHDSYDSDVEINYCANFESEKINSNEDSSLKSPVLFKPLLVENSDSELVSIEVDAEKNEENINNSDNDYSNFAASEMTLKMNTNRDMPNILKKSESASTKDNSNVRNMPDAFLASSTCKVYLIRSFYVTVIFAIFFVNS